MIVSTFPLQGLDEDSRHPVFVLLTDSFNLSPGLRLGGLDVIADVAVQIKLDGRVVHPGPIEFREQGDLVRYRVRHAQGVARASVEGLAKVQDN